MLRRTLFLACVLSAMFASTALAAPGNDNFASAINLGSVPTATITGDNNGATKEGAEDDCCFVRNSVWWRWTAPKTANYRLELCASNFNTSVNVKTGSTLSNLDRIADNDDALECGGDGKRSSVAFIGGQGQEYYFQIGSSAQDQTGSLSGSIKLVSPSNDFFADSQLLEGTSTPISATNVDATKEAGEDDCCFVRNSIWYKWTSPKTGNYRLEVCGSSFNTAINVSSGTAVNALDRVASNDDAVGCGADGKRSSLTFIAGGGQEYRFQIGSSVQDQTGTITGSLTLVSPPNDFFADATQLTGAPAAINATNVDATKEAGEDDCCFTRHSVWFKWTAPAAGSYKLDLCGSSFNTNVNVKTGTAVGALERIANNDDSPGCGADGKRSSVTFTAGAGQEYKFQIGSSVENQTGSIVGSIALAAPATPTPKLDTTVLPPSNKPPISGGGVTKGRGGKYVLKVKGTFKLPPGYTAAQACKGDIILTVKKGKKQITGARIAKLSKTCKYSKTISIARSKIGSAKTLSLTVRFGGNEFLVATARTYKIKVKRR